MDCLLHGKACNLFIDYENTEVSEPNNWTGICSVGPYRGLTFFPLKITGPINYSLIFSIPGGNGKETAKD